MKNPKNEGCCTGHSVQNNQIAIIFQDNVGKVNIIFS